MSHLNIYLDPHSSRLIARAAKREKKSLSRWAREKLLLAAGSPEWPPGYSELLGSLQDERFLSPPEPENDLEPPPSFS